MINPKRYFVNRAPGFVDDVIFNTLKINDFPLHFLILLHIYR